MVVLPSLWEGLPLVLVEAMQRGVPVVTTHVGGIEEFSEGNADIVITPSDWSEFANGLQTMAARVRRGDVNSGRLHRWAEDRYGYAAVSSKWLSALLDPAGFFSAEQEAAHERVTDAGRS
jgi:glycosyltransferase involved in cell wall biosynthesis